MVFNFLFFLLFTLFQSEPRSCAPGGAALFVSCGESSREENSVRLLVFLHPRLSHRGITASYSPHNYSEGPLSKGTTHAHTHCAVLDRYDCNISLLTPPSRWGCVHFRCCQPCWIAPGSSWLWLKIRRLLEHLTPLSPSRWRLLSESCTAPSVWPCWPRPPHRLSRRS